MTLHRIRKAVNGLLGDTPTLPIPIESIVRGLGIYLLPYELGQEASGILVVERDKVTIGYNKAEHLLRNRFTIAHELGHYMLHRDGELFVDREFKYTLRRLNTATPSKEKQEWEANEFAACILMPEFLLREELEKVDLGDEGAVQTLANIFHVSTVAMSIRITRLGLAL